MLDFYKEHDQDIKKEARTEFLPMFRECYKEYGSLAVVQMAHDLCQEFLDRSGLFEQTSCKNSCSFCCHDRIEMGVLESRYIAEIIKLNNLKGDEVRKTLQRELPKESLNFMARACPMLSDENEQGQRLCSIYIARPLVCRTHNSADDPKYCNRVEYPTTFVREGRAVRIEAIGVALMFLEQELGLQGEKLKMVAMHEI